MTNHSPEPWHIELGFEHHALVDAQGNTLLTSHHAFWKEVYRVMACVNACKGFSTEELEKLLSHDGTLAHFITVSPEDAETIRNSPDEGIVRLEDNHEPT